jgi:hypothetical protein
MIPIGILTAAATSSFSFLLNDYPSATAAYSFRKLHSGYTGSCIRVRRSSDNAQQDIGFVNNVIDTTTLITFVGSGDGYVEIWYDQSGNVNNASPTVTNVNNTKIVSAGTLITQNGKVSSFYNGFGLKLINSISSSVDISVYIIGKPLNNNSLLIIGHDVNFQGPMMGKFTNEYVIGCFNGTNMSFTLTAPFSANNDYQIINTYYTGSQISTFYKNNINIGTFSTVGYTQQTTNFNTIGTYPSYSSVGNISEIIIYKSNQLSNRTGINGNINTYYTIF